MSRILNLIAYFLLSLSTTAFFGLVGRSVSRLTPWFWVLFLLYLVVLIVIATVYGRKAYAGLLNTSESVLISVVACLGFGALLGGIGGWL